MTQSREPMQDERMGGEMERTDTERVLADWFAEEAPQQEPPVLLPAVLARTAMTRRRPAWLTRDWWLDLLGLVDRPRPPMMLSVGFVAVLTGLALAAMFLLVPGGPTEDRAAPESFVVALDGSGDFTTLDDAIDAAEDGDTILIQPGRYEAAIETGKSLIFRGNGEDRADVVIAASTMSAPAVRATDAALTFEHLTVLLAAPNQDIYPESAFLPFGIHVVGGPVRIDDVDFSGGFVGAGCGLVLERGTADPDSSGASSVSGARFAGSGAGVCADPIGPFVIQDSTFADTEVAMRLAGEGIEVLANTFTNNGEGVVSTVGKPLAVTVTGNEFSGNGTALRLIGASVDVADNTFSGGDTGIKLTQADGAVEGNTLSDIRSLGLDLQATDLRVEGNTFAGGADAVRLIGGTPTLSGNDIEGAAGTAIAASGGAQPVITDNRLCGNASDFELPDEVQAAVSGTLGCEDG